VAASASILSMQASGATNAVASATQSALGPPQTKLKVSPAIMR
jgi:hypothetical protein